MVARDTSPDAEEAARVRHLFTLAALAAQIGPYRRIFGVLKQIRYPSGQQTQLISQNTTRAGVVFVTVSAIGTAVLVFNKSEALGAMGQKLALNDNTPGANNNYQEFILFPGDELHATAGGAIPVVVQVNEQSFY